ncbi:hypothetical protein AGABI1DRAFT_116220 [Agaricus bisporus var. burnettii JB137-S8]|uniref:Arf-GAP domain-containing protein n=1 Tax=Agaricus bisporus var. burnettii (strain JB137-S8 / ATCC MYA-4627 / FGSC 10392) TaxID=597362 RepID=K5WY55_AGABU|nr:uncharacterized protein AGABI1DRAFT_116220 [Agaricus bisporus var. burnettii JB137-S8]EKM75753.1 hypothetical protein AGABI1DRAFT_116220 [Agaricus bisporus var. burnettii JB137-S8]
MGTHISKVKSVDLDMWTPEQMESIQKWGNRRANLYWEAHLKPGHIPPEHKMESFVRSKYESRRWAMDGPPPRDPAVLDSGNAAQTTAAPPPPSQEQSITAPSTTSTRSSGTASPSRGSRFTAQQPQPHQLLSSNFAKPNSVQASAQPAAVQAAQPPAPQDDLFSLDFHAPSSATPANAAPQQPAKDVKQDILSLFSTTPANSNSNPTSNPNAMNQFGMGNWNVQPQAQQSVQPAQPTSMIGNSGIGAWGASSGWAPAPTIPAQANVWGTQAGPGLSPQQANLMNTNDIWGGSSVPAGGNGFSSTTQKKDDVFGDLWGSFK